MKTINDISVFEPGDVINIEIVKQDYIEKSKRIKEEEEEHKKIYLFNASSFTHALNACDKKINFIKDTTKLIIIDTTVKNPKTIYYKCLSQWGMISTISAKDLSSAVFEKRIDELKDFFEEVKQ